MKRDAGLLLPALIVLALAMIGVGWMMSHM
jgi:hypothetical protein